MRTGRRRMPHCDGNEAHLDSHFECRLWFDYVYKLHTSLVWDAETRTVVHTEYAIAERSTQDTYRLVEYTRLLEFCGKDINSH